ncbi:hypothetical protein [Streptomyces shenzhenensis]|uniref:hypothetical protein n=1 Tax=Streptomyces shenzhenensis TaxID=943815 RepID=UPI0033E94AFF
MISGVVILGALGGLGLSMLAPYIPLVLTSAQVSPVAAWRISAVTVTLLAVVYVALAISSFCREIIQSEMFPARWRGRRFGFAQSGFLAGDAIGGTVGAVVLTHGGTSGLLFIYAGTSAVTAVVYPVFILVLHPADAMIYRRRHGQLRDTWRIG